MYRVVAAFWQNELGLQLFHCTDLRRVRYAALPLVNNRRAPQRGPQQPIGSGMQPAGCGAAFPGSPAARTGSGANAGGGGGGAGGSAEINGVGPAAAEGGGSTSVSLRLPLCRVALFASTACKIQPL